MSAAQGATARPGTRGRALLIEDVAADRALLESVLMERGYEPLVPDRNDLDPASLGQPVPRVILLSADVKNGFNLCLRFKKDPVLRRVPLLLMTAKASPEVVRKHRMLPTRADAYLMKPLGREALLQALLDVLPEDFAEPPPAVEAVTLAPAPRVREREEEVSEVPDRTLVSPGQLEKAVVDYVEDEVRTLRDAVERLMSEKSESRPRARIESTEAALPPVEPGVPPEEVEARLEEARSAAYREGLEAGRAERRTKGIEQARREGRQEAEAEFVEEREALEARAGEAEARVTALEKQVRALDAQARAADARGQAADARAKAAEGELETLRSQSGDKESREEELRAELDQTTLLFERLEAGYKDALSKAEADKAAALEAAAAAEVERDHLREALAEVRETLQAMEAALAERNTHCETLEADCATLRRRVETASAAGARVGELEIELAELAQQLEASRESLADLEPLRQQAGTARAEAERLAARLDRVREALEGDA